MTKGGNVIMSIYYVKVISQVPILSCLRGE
jgi:hypothetical protein